MTKDKKKLRKLSREVIADISNRAASSQKGVHSVKSVKTTVDEDDGVNISVSINAIYGVKIPDLAWHVQNAVNDAVQGATLLKVNRVDIHISGVKLDRSLNLNQDDAGYAYHSEKDE